ncbi:MAG: phosphate/phosphite/phosphonate ABC transporter substrate-binding protein [Syntrophobacterales bacterium]|jgi:phosphonate transport system substrate-binding protein
MIRMFGMLLIILFLQVTSISAEVQKKPINIAVLPCTDIVMTFKKFHPLVTYLTQKTGLPIRLVVPENLTKFETSLHNGEIDFALQDPHTFLKLSNLFDKDSLLRTLNLEGGTTQSGVIIVRKDSGIHKVTDLKKKTVMFGPKFSASKWLAGKLLLEDNGIDIEKDLKAYLNGGCCEDIAFNVYLKAVDAGVVCDHFAGEHEDKQKELGVDSSQIIVIAKTKDVPMKVFGARKGTEKETIIKIRQALLNLDRHNPDDMKILYPTELGGFRVYSDGDFGLIRMLMSSK